MIQTKIDELFQAINNSKEYQTYLKIESILENNHEIKQLVSEIKKLQQKSVNLEYQNDERYKKVEEEIAEKVKLLNSKPIYQEYLRRMNELNDILAESSSQIEKYINSKI